MLRAAKIASLVVALASLALSAASSSQASSCGLFLLSGPPAGSSPYIHVVYAASCRKLFVYGGRFTASGPVEIVVDDKTTGVVTSASTTAGKHGGLSDLVKGKCSQKYVVNAIDFRTGSYSNTVTLHTARCIPRITKRHRPPR